MTFRSYECGGWGHIRIRIENNDLAKTVVFESAAARLFHFWKLLIWGLGAYKNKNRK